MNLSEMLELLDYKRRVAEIYASVRRTDDPAEAWNLWRQSREWLFAEHAQSALPEEERGMAGRLDYFPYDPSYRVSAEVKTATAASFEIPSSHGQTMTFTRTGVAEFGLGGELHTLDLFWLEGYGGGLFLPFKDATSGKETYGGGRYLFDTVKGADLGSDVASGYENNLLLDFNFAYNPSCSYNPKWACPLSPPSNTLSVEVRAGEKHRA